jgi:hypothetical protein
MEFWMTLPAKVAPLASFVCQKQDPIDLALLSLCLIPWFLIISTQNAAGKSKAYIQQHSNLLTLPDSFLSADGRRSRSWTINDEPTHQKKLQWFEKQQEKL